MEIPGLGSVNNPLRLDPRITSPDLIPGKLPTRITEQKSQEAPVQTPLTLPGQPPKVPVLTQNLQTFTNLLLEIGLPNTPQNNELASVLASYGQPVNKNTMSQVAQALGPLVNKGVANIEAGVILMINGMQINPTSVDAVKHLLTGGGMAQNLLNFNKDLQKLVENINNKDVRTEITKQLEQKNIINAPIQDGSSNIMNQQIAGQSALIGSKENVERIKPETTAVKMQEGKVDALNQVQKNPYGEENDNDSVNEEGKKLVSQGSKKGSNLPVKVEIPEIRMLAPHEIQQLITQIGERAQKLNHNIISMLTVDILNNPSQFPMQISMLKKYFSEFESNVKEFNEILNRIFPELSITNENEDENIFKSMLRLVVEDETVNPKIKNIKNLKSAANFDAGFLENIAKTSESLNLSIIGREILTRNFDCLCLPISIPVKGQLYNVEIMILREDKSNKKADVGQLPLKILLSVETKHMGKVSVDIRNLKKNLQVNMSVQNNTIKEEVQQNLDALKEVLKSLSFNVQSLQCIVNPKQNESPSILLPNKYKVMSMKRIEGIA